MKKTDKTISLSKAIIVPFLGIAGFFLIFALVVYLFTAKLHNEHESLYQKTISESSNVVYLFDKIQQIKNNVYKVINEKNQLVADAELETIKNNLTEVLTFAGSENNHKVWNGNQENIVALLRMVNASLLEVEKYVHERNTLMQQRFKNLQELRCLGLSVKNLLNEKTIQHAEVINLVYVLINDLLLVNSDIPMFYSIKVYNRLLFNFDKLEQMLAGMKNKQLTEFFVHLSQMMQENTATLFLDLEKLYNQETSLLIYLDSLSNQINIISAKLYDELHVSAKKQNVFMKDIMDYLQYFSIVICVFFVIFIVLAYRFISSHVINPVRVLGDFIKQRIDNAGCSCVEQKVMEIRDISCAVYDFVAQIEDNEKSLLESHQNLEKQVLERTEEIRQLSEKIITVSEEERFKLAAELHDDIGSSIGTVKFGIEHALCLLNNKDMEDAKESLDSSVQIVKSVASQLRCIQTDLRPPHLDIGLLKILEWYIEDYKNIHSTIHVQADFFFDELLLSTSMQIVTYRIVQEGMNNVAKHSHATEVLLQVIYDEDFRIIIADNGVGMQNTETGSGHGLKNINERIKVSGGEFIVESSDQGTKITALWKNLNTVQN